MSKTALITGISGQDGRCLARYLLDIGYKVYGLIRRVSHPDLSFIEEMGLQDVILIEGDLSDSLSLREAIQKSNPDEVYNFAAMSHVATSFSQPEYTIDVTGVGVLRLLEVIREFNPKIKFYAANTSEFFGDAIEIPQNEKTEFRPRSPYAAAKILGHHLCKVYRESYNMFCVSGILFNHEHKSRSKTFVTRKITDYIGRLVNDKVSQPLDLGYLDAKRDWGWAPDFVYAAYLMLQQELPDDYVVATGECHTVREFAELAFKRAGINLQWRGHGVLEEGYDADTGRTLIKINPEFYRPAEVPILLGDSTKAREKLGWKPSVTFIELVHMMVDADIERNKERDCSTNETNYSKAT